MNNSPFPRARAVGAQRGGLLKAARNLAWAACLAAAAQAAAAADLLPDAPVAHFGRHIVINVPQLRLHVYEDGVFDHAYPIGVGRSVTPTPVGEWIIHGKRGRSSNRATGATFVHFGPPGKAYGMHGTNQPYLLPAVLSHGCVRMEDQNALEISAHAQRGNPVSVVYQRYLLNQDAKGNLWLAVFGDPYGWGSLDRDKIEAALKDWMAARGYEYKMDPDKIFATARKKPLCLTCNDAAPTGALSTLLWTQGLGRPRTFADGTWGGATGRKYRPSQSSARAKRAAQAEALALAQDIDAAASSRRAARKAKAAAAPRRGPDAGTIDFVDAASRPAPARPERAVAQPRVVEASFEPIYAAPAPRPARASAPAAPTHGRMLGSYGDLGSMD